MAQHNTTGQHGEVLAQEYLINKGYTIVQCNWRYRKFEIDIVATYNNTLIFVEVKTRASTIINASAVITNAKQTQLINALHEYCVLHNITTNAQIDVLLINGNNHVEHLQDVLR